MPFLEPPWTVEKDTGRAVSLLLQKHVEAVHQKSLHEWKGPSPPRPVQLGC